MDIMNQISPSTIDARLSDPRAFTSARLRSVAGQIGGDATVRGDLAIGGNSAPGSAPELL